MARYYDLIASLPLLPYFARAVSAPITRLRLTQRLRRLTPEHAAQLERAQGVVGWRPQQPLDSSDRALLTAYRALRSEPLDRSLAAYAEFRLEQRLLVSALRRRGAGREPPDIPPAEGAAERVRYVRRHWEAPDFRLAHVHAWLPAARQSLEAGAGDELERLLMDVAWRRLGRCAEVDMFSFAAVFAYVFKWELLHEWLARDAERAAVRFSALIEQVIHVDDA